MFMRAKYRSLFHLAGAMMFAALAATQVQAGSFTVTLTQQNGNVVASGSGAIDLTGLSFDGDISSFSCGYFGLLVPSTGFIAAGGDTCPLAGDRYLGPISGPVAFGTGDYTIATGHSGTGDIFSLHAPSNEESFLIVPQGYMSGDPLSDGSTWDNANFGDLGVTPGTYVWTWGTAADQSFTLDVLAPRVPEPSSVAVFGGGLLVLSFVMLRRRRRSNLV